jgi:integrase
MEIIVTNPCRGIEGNPVTSRERILSDSEIAAFWKKFDDHGPIKSSALKILLLTGQRKSKVSWMRTAHVVDNWWTLPGQPETHWPGVKNSRTHSIFLSDAVQEIIADVGSDNGFVFGRAVSGLDAAMRDICQKLGVERAVVHDLRRTFATIVTRLGHNRQSMDRVLNHADRSVGAIYDRHRYLLEDQRLMESVSRHIVAITEGEGGDNVVREKFNASESY